MAILDGCHEGKHTPKLLEVLCPKCGNVVEVFVKMGGGPAETGRIIHDETCTCGHVIQSGTPAASLEEA